MLRHNNEPKSDIPIVTKENYVATIKAAESKNFVTIEKFYVMKKKYKRSEMSQGKFFTTRDSMLHTEKFSQ